MTSLAYLNTRTKLQKKHECAALLKLQAEINKDWMPRTVITSDILAM